MLDRARTLVAEALRAPSKPLDEASINGRVRQALAGFFRDETGRRPMIVPLPIEM